MSAPPMRPACRRCCATTRKAWGSARPSAWAGVALRHRSASLALALQELGVGPGDRVAAYLPNGAQAVIAFLACASIGAVWSICAPDMGTNAVLDRFRQIEPRVLIACDGITYGGRDHPGWTWWPSCGRPCPR
jgi:acetoacetyl-CoA synthetase